MNKDLILFSGYAKLPSGITASEIYKVIGIVIVVNIITGDIVEADCTLATKVANKHVASTLINFNLNDGIEPILAEVDRNYQGGAKKALLTALRIIYDKYRCYKDGSETDVK